MRGELSVFEWTGTILVGDSKIAADNVATDVVVVGIGGGTLHDHRSVARDHPGTNCNTNYRIRKFRYPSNTYSHVHTHSILLAWAESGPHFIPHNLRSSFGTASSWFRPLSRTTVVSRRSVSSGNLLSRGMHATV